MKRAVLFKALLVTVCFIGIGRMLFPQATTLEYLMSYGLYPFIKVQQTMVNYLKRWSQERASYQELMQKLIGEQKRSQELQKELIEARSSHHYCYHTADLSRFLEKYRLKEAYIASVMLKHFDGSHFFIVDKGARTGIKKNMIAVYKNCLVGRVIEVYPLYSKVMLITDPLCKVAAFCSTSTAEGIYEGTGSKESALLSYLNPTDKVKKGELVLSSGKGLIFPQGFGLGYILQAEREGPHSTILLSLLLDYRTLEYCALIPHDTTLVEDDASALV